MPERQPHIGPQVQIWALPGQPLREEQWLKHGYESLEDYVISERDGHTAHLRQACQVCVEMSSQSLVSFGSLDPVTGFSTVKMICQTAEDLPTGTIDGVLIFNK